MSMNGRRRPRADQIMSGSPLLAAADEFGTTPGAEPLSFPERRRWKMQKTILTGILAGLIAAASVQVSNAQGAGGAGGGSAGGATGASSGTTGAGTGTTGAGTGSMGGSSTGGMSNGAGSAVGGQNSVANPSGNTNLNPSASGSTLSPNIPSTSSTGRH
jgi:hypothetical protein